MTENINMFSHQLLAEKIANTFDGHWANNSFVMAINGAWGTGKTHLMDNVIGVLNDSDYIKVKFNAWRFSQKEEIWRALLICIQDSCKSYVDNEENQKRLGWNENDVSIISKLFEDAERALYTAFTKEIPGEININTGNVLKTGLNMALKFVPWGNCGSEIIKKFLVKKNDSGEAVSPTVEKEDLEALWGIFSRSSIKRNIEKVTSVEQFRKSFETLIKAILKGEFSDATLKQELTKHTKNLKLVVAIDDLDRCLPENALEILEAIKLFLDCPGVFFMIAMDSNIIQQGLNVRYGQQDMVKVRAKDYYEKMIDLSFNIPALLEQNFFLYINSISKNGDDYIKMFPVLSIALKSNLRAWERYVYRADFNRTILMALANDSIFQKRNVLNAFLKLQCLSYQWPEFYRLLYDSKIYLAFEKICMAIVDYETRCIQDIREDIGKSVGEEIGRAIPDKLVIDIVRSEPQLASIQNYEGFNAFFTFDKIV